jgi:hypothetical protein
LSIITAKAEDAAGVSLPNALVRARDARYGRIVATLVTNKAGNVVFEGLDPCWGPRPAATRPREWFQRL